MEPKVNDQRHQSFQNLLGAAAFGTLTAEEQRLLRPHLDGCAECQAELADYQVIASGLALTLDEREPSRELRGRIEASIRQGSSRTGRQLGSWDAAAAPEQQAFVPLEQTSRPTPPPITTSASRNTVTRLRSRYVWVTAALLLLAVVAGTLAGRMIFADDSTQDTTGETIALQMDPPIPNASGELIYLPDEQVFKLTMHNMPAPPAGQVYQVWLIDAEAAGPLPVGVVDEASGQFAVAADRSRYDVFAITVEPGPLGSQAPTTTPIITAPLAESS